MPDQGFSSKAKLTALAIVKIFETSRPFGDYSAVAVLNDGAGISYGINQFTHRSGSLAAVIERYAELKGFINSLVADALPDFKSGRNIAARSGQPRLKQALRDLGEDRLMQQAQREIAFENYLKPALDACEGSDFTLPLSLAVIYDSINHGSYERIRDRVVLELPPSIKPDEYEREWIEEYVNKRHSWLRGVARLKATAYRTQFFIDQIKRGNWELDLPVLVHGVKLTASIIETFEDMHDDELTLEVPSSTAEESALSQSSLPEGPAKEPVEPSAAEAIAGLVPGDSSASAEIKVTEEKQTPEGTRTEETTVSTPAGDGAEADASHEIVVEDWKPFCFRWAKRVWGSFTGVNIPQFSGLSLAAGKDPANWYIYIGIGLAVFVVLGGCAAVISGVLLLVWYFNRKEIAAAKMESARSFVDPDRKNLGVRVERK